MSCSVKNTTNYLKVFESFYDSFCPAKENTAEAFVWFSGVPHPVLNAVMHLSCKRSVAEKVDNILKMAPANTPLSFWHHSQNQAKELVQILKERGFQPLKTCAMMAWDAKPIQSPLCSFRPANPKTFFDNLGIAFHLNESMLASFAKMMGKNKLAENFELYSDNIPESTGTLICHGKVGAVFNISTIPELQKRGCATAMMQFLMHRAYARGVEKLILLSSPQAIKLFSNLGFETLFDIELYAK